jgi:hypothetical protein
MMTAATAKAMPEPALTLSDPLQRSVLHTQVPMSPEQLISGVAEGAQFLIVPRSKVEITFIVKYFFLYFFL